jgi:serine O-acetyltransferase
MPDPSQDILNDNDERTQLLKKIEEYDHLSLRELIRSDLICWENISIALFKLGFYSTFFYRVSHWFFLKRLNFLAKCLQFISHLITGAEISNKAVIGPGLIILHPTAVHIGPKIKIGANANICECCAIINNIEYGEGEPVIGDFLWAGSGSKILGPITLGDHVWVGPNSVVLKDVGSNMTALGIPARIMPKTFRRKTPAVKE